MLEPTYVKSSDKAEGTIVSQDPPAGTEVDKGSTVKVEVVSGKELVQVPQLTGVPEADAIRAITDAKLVLGVRTESFDEGIVAGSLIGTAIPAGTEVPTGTAIDYEVSKGPEPTPSPTPSPTPASVTVGTLRRAHGRRGQLPGDHRGTRDPVAGGDPGRRQHRHGPEPGRRLEGRARVAAPPLGRRPDAGAHAGAHARARRRYPTPEPTPEPTPVPTPTPAP